MSDKVSKETLEQLMEGNLPWEDTKDLLRMHPKDPERFWTYLELLQERVSWDDPILMRINDHLFIVAKPDGRVVKCDCGYEFGDYRVNWKLESRIRIRDTLERFMEIYHLAEVCPDPDLLEIREFFCPGCAAQLSVEAALHGEPLLFDFFPDLDTFYRDWLGKPLADENPENYTDKTSQQTRAWAAEETR